MTFLVALRFYGLLMRGVWYAASKYMSPLMKIAREIYEK